MPASVTDPTTCGASVSGAGADDVFSDYDLLGRKLSARFASVSGSGIVYTYDALGRILTEKETWNNRTLSYIWDPAPIRRRVTYPDGNYIRTTYDALNRADQVQENGASSGAGLLADYTYDDLGRPTSVAYGNTTATSLSYAPASQDWSFTQDLNSTAQDVTVAFTKSAGHQTLTRGISNASYNYAAPTRSESYTRNGLNQYTNVAGATFTNDARGNLTGDGTRTFTYDLENRLLSVTGGSASITLTYDPLGRLRTQLVGGTTTTTFLYAGDQLVAEYNGSTLLRRYAWGPGVDRPLIWYEGSGLTTRYTLHTDEQGSVIATSNGSGAGTLYSYSSYGEPDSTRAWTNTNSRFRYTGQIALFEAQLYHYKARVYDPKLGRFLQTDPVGYEDNFNLYAYVGNDPLNSTDSSGRQMDPYTMAQVDHNIQELERTDPVAATEANAGAVELIGDAFQIAGSVPSPVQPELKVAGTALQLGADAIRSSEPTTRPDFVTNSEGVTMSTKEDFNLVDTQRSSAEGGDWLQIHNTHEHDGMSPHSHFPERHEGPDGRGSVTRQTDATTGQHMNEADQRLRNGELRPRRNRSDKGGE